MKNLLVLLLLVGSAFATNYEVKSGGGGNYTTIQACATAMAAGDTCTVYAGTYNENVTVTAGTVGNYKTLTVNGSDVVTVLSFVLNSHTKLVGNCTAPAAINTCGFNIQNPSSPGAAPCVTTSTSATDVYIVNNVMYACANGIGNSGSTSGAAINIPATGSYIYIQGNTCSYPADTVANPVFSGKCIDMGEPNTSPTSVVSYVLVENNDFSHYTLGVKFSAQHSIFRNNTFHDQLETEGSSNKHTDIFFSEQLYNVYDNVIEGNFERNAVGPNAKGVLAQGDTPCSGCTNLIVRYDVTSRIGSAVSSNYPTWPLIKSYNNTHVDLNMEGASSGQETDHNSTPSASYLNQLYYYSNPSSWTNWNVYDCGASCTFGYNLYWCVNTCSAPWGHTYGSTPLFTSETGNQHADPKFVNYVSPGSTSNNYHLQSSSPAIAAGTYLTTVASGDSGSGTSLVVTDAAYFQDSYGLTNANSTVYPDCISVTTVTNHVCIAISGINYSTNTITLQSSITRSVGDHVWLYSKSDNVRVLTGSAPDLGAFPFTSGSLSFTVSPTVIPSYHSGNVQIAITGSGTAWTSGTAFSAGSPCTTVSSTVNAGAQTGTVTVTTTSSTGSCTITDSTDSAAALVTVANPFFTISPTSGTPGSGGCTTTCQGTITFTGTNTVWANIDQSATGLFTLSTVMGTCTGDSLGTITVSSNTSATATLTWGSTSCTEGLTDTSNGNSSSNIQNFTVQAITTPVVTTGTAGSLTPTSATISGNSYVCGGSCPSVTSEGTCYGLSANPTTPCTSDGTTSPWSSSITGRTAATTYHYVAFATNSAGTSYGSDQTFTTPIMTYVKGAGNASSTPSTTFTFSYTASNTNDAIVVAAYCNDGGTVPSAATLTASGWTIAQLGTVVSNGTGAGALFGTLAPNTSAATFTAGFGAACSSFYGYMIGEFQGNTTMSLAAAFPAQGSSGGTSSFACNQTGAGITPSGVNNAVWNACFGSPTSVNSPWTAGTTDGSGGDLSEYQLLSGNPGMQVPGYTGTTGLYVVLGTAIAPTNTAPAPPTGFQGKIIAKGNTGIK